MKLLFSFCYFHAHFEYTKNIFLIIKILILHNFDFFLPLSYENLFLLNYSIFIRTFYYTK